MKSAINSQTYVELGMVGAILTAVAFIGVQYGRLNAQEDDIKAIKQGLVIIGDIREHLANIEGQLSEIKLEQKRVNQ